MDGKEEEKKGEREREREWWYIGIKEGATWMERREEGAKKKKEKVNGFSLFGH